MNPGGNRRWCVCAIISPTQRPASVQAAYLPALMGGVATLLQFLESSSFFFLAVFLGFLPVRIRFTPLALRDSSSAR